MIYLKAPNQDPHEYLLKSQWGPFTRYLEIGEDLYTVRHVDLYANGYALRYDRTHWIDEFGMLANIRYDRKKWETWWGKHETIEAAEFENVWQSAVSSPLWPQQIASAKMSKFGEAPIWLARRKDDS